MSTCTCAGTFRPRVDPHDRKEAPSFEPTADLIIRQYVHAWLCEHDASQDLHDAVDDLPPIRAVWVDHTCDPKITREPVVIFQGRCLGGVTWGPDGPTYVAVSRSGLLGPTSYVHETAHIWHYVVKGDGDSGHRDDDWWGYFLDVIKPAVAAAELQQ